MTITSVLSIANYQQSAAVCNIILIQEDAKTQTVFNMQLKQVHSMHSECCSRIRWRWCSIVTSCASLQSDNYCKYYISFRIEGLEKLIDDMVGHI